MDDQHLFKKSIADYKELLSEEAPTSAEHFRLLESLLEGNSSYDVKRFNKDTTEIELKIREMKKHHEDFQTFMRGFPFKSLVFLWAKFMGKDEIFGDRYLKMMRELIAKNLFPWEEGGTSGLGMYDISLLSHCKPELFGETIENIRSYKEWSIEKREDYVSFITGFFSWLSKETYGDVDLIVDQAREITKHRKLPFEEYIKIITELDQRERLLARMFYLGGARSLEEVLSLKIEEIHFRDRKLFFSGEEVSYPGHVFRNLKNYIGDRKSGFVFVGKNGERINHTVPYRALKTVAAKMGLDSSFTFKEFTKNA